MREILKILCLSDTHGLNFQLGDILRGYEKDDIDLLVFAGDISGRSRNDSEETMRQFSDFPCEHKVIIAGNHDFEMDKWGRELAKKYGLIYLENELCIIEGIKIFGSPFSVQFGNWAFMRNDNELSEIWDLIPEDTDILITHSPPFEILDTNYQMINCGSKTLRDRVEMIKPRLHVFGHIHESQGIYYSEDTIFVNASLTDFLCTGLSDGIVIDLKK